VTRRCAQRQFLLTPSATTSQIFGFLLAVAALRYGVDVHAFCVMSNHYHLVITDRRARLPAFQQFLDALVARAMNARLGRWESFWAPDSYSAVQLTTPSDVLDKISYVLANPVAAGLVATGCIWPGLWSSPEQIGGEPVVLARPAEFFDPDGPLPDTVELRVTAPGSFISAAQFRSALVRALEAREERARRTWQARGGFLGVARVLAQSPTAHPRGREQRRALDPRVAARDPWKRIEALGRLAEFVAAYRDAHAAWRRGRRDVPFPAGTYLMRVLHGATCAAVT
jgi:REP element-mobilizing transposase RayT